MNEVLLVNDKIDNWINAALLLEDMGWDVVIAHSDEVVFHAIAKRRPMMVVIDIEMNGGVGFKAIATARGFSESLYIIAITRGGDKDIWSRVATDCGANSYIVGPITKDKLSASIQAGIDNGQIYPIGSASSSRTPEIN